MRGSVEDFPPCPGLSLPRAVLPCWWVGGTWFPNCEGTIGAVVGNEEGDVINVQPGEASLFTLPCRWAVCMSPRFEMSDVMLCGVVSQASVVDY